MCSSPIRIPNPNLGRRDKLSYLFDTTSHFINIPCGHCDECISVLQMSIVQRALMESCYNHMFMATLTYNDEHLPSVTCSSGVTFKYADYNHLTTLFSRLKNIGAFPRGFRYFAVSELGERRSRPHFHVVFITPKLPSDDYNYCLSEEQRLSPIVLNEWYNNLGSSRRPVRDPLCTYVRYYKNGRWRSNYDFHYINPRGSGEDVAPVAFYVTKYLLKRRDKDYKRQCALKFNLPEDEYLGTWRLIRSRWHSSRYFGLNPSYSPFGDFEPDLRITNYLHTCVQKSKGKFPYPCFINPFNGLWFPLAHFYKQFGSIYDLNDATFFAMDNPLDISEFRSYYDNMRSSNRRDFLDSISNNSDLFDEYL